MNLNAQIDKSLEQIIKESRPMKAKRAPKPKSKAAPPMEAKKRRSKNKSATSDAMVVDALAGRLGSSTRRVAATGRLAGRVGKGEGSRRASGRAASGESGRLSGRVGKAAGGRLAGKAAGGRLAGLAERTGQAGAPSKPISIKGEAGPATVFISNLDTEATPEDVKTCFKQFGAIKACTLLYDHSGKASGHAEVTYASKVAAEEAAAKLNNVLADGRKLSVRLVPSSQSVQKPTLAPFARAKLPVAPGKSRKSKRSGAGRMDID
ncbi:hypothetical protein GGF43_002858 [Coemansia sp. RSA 2618]|nr:hypothetical protein GGF43_002858 [Coemansia sp. RSA 2618]